MFLETKGSDFKVKDYYGILGVESTSSKDEIKKAYRKLAKQWHPDVSKSDNAHEKFIEITEAYEILIDDHNRAQYDAIRSNSYYSQNDNDFNKRQNEAREKGKYYSTISFDEFLQKALNIVVEVGRSTLFGEDEYNQSITVKKHIGIGVKGWLSVLFLILSFTGVLAPVTIPILLKINLVDEGRVVGIKNIFTGMFIFGGIFLSIIFGIYIIFNIEYVLEDIFFYLYFSPLSRIYILLPLIIAIIYVVRYFHLKRESGAHFAEKKLKGFVNRLRLKDFIGLFFLILGTACMMHVESKNSQLFDGLIALGLSFLFYPMGIFHWLFMSKYKNFFMRLIIGILFFVISGFYMDSMYY